MNYDVGLIPAVAQGSTEIGEELHQLIKETPSLSFIDIIEWWAPISVLHDNLQGIALDESCS